MAALPAPTQRTSTAIAAATATLITLAVLAVRDRMSGATRTSRAGTALATHTGEELTAEADVLLAVAAHRDAIQRGERHIHAIPDPGRRHSQRTG